MVHLKTLLIAAPVAVGLLAAPSAHAEWRHGGWGGHYEHRGPGGAVVGALLGLGAAAVVGGVIASQVPPPVVYAPRPSYYYPGYSYPAPYYPAPYYPAPYYADPGYGG